jgi:signal transduction histidine kinase/CheY-like chemotaxis protein
MNKWSISKRAIFLGLAPAVFMFFALTAYFIHDKLEVLQTQLDNKGELLVQQLAPATEYAVFIKNPTLLEDTVSPILNQVDVAYVEIYDDNGELLLSRKNLSLIDDFDHSTIRQFKADIVLQDVPLESSEFSLGLESLDGPKQDKVIGSITIGLTTQQLKQAQKEALLGGMFIALLSLFFATLLALFISRTITNPVKSLSETVTLFKSGLLSARVAERSGGELGTLESNVNAMAVSLERAKRKELEHAMALEQARAEAQAASQAKSQFLLSVSHLLRRSMTGSLGHLQLLEASQLDLKQKGYVEQTIISLAQLLDLLEKIVDYSQLLNQSYSLKPHFFDLNRLFNRCRASLIATCQKKNIDLHIHLDEKHSNIDINTDSTALQKIVLSILSNAANNTEQGYIDVIVKWSPIEEQHKLLLTIDVSDTGLSYTEEQLSTLMTISNPLPVTNSGIELPFQLELLIVKQLTDLLGGTIHLTPQADGGTRYLLEFIFPYRINQSKDSDSLNEDSQKASPINGRVLVIDPNPVDLQVAKEMLNLFGATVNTAITAQIGLERIRQFSYQLVIIDTDVKDESVIALVDRIKAFAKAKNQILPILITTVESNIDPLRKILSDPFDDILEKPYSMQQLKYRIQTQLSRVKQHSLSKT